MIWKEGEKMEPSALIDPVQRIRRDQCESPTIEVKAASQGTPRKLYDTLSGFSNQDEGGIIIFGLDEKNGFEAVSQHMGSTWTSVKNGYISRLPASGLLRMTKPDTPKVRDQRYTAVR